MQLTKHTDYAFRVLMYLATKPDGELSTIKEVTAAFDISRDHVMKIVQKLAKEGYINSIRGKQGGMKLGRNAADINLREIVTLMETTLEPVNCRETLCKISSGCQLAGILFAAQELFMAHIEQYTLADLVMPNTETVHLINTLLIEQLN